MAEPQPTPTEPGAVVPAPKAAQPQQRGPPLHQIYALPVPVRTFPLPAFYPHNPVSLFHVACAWLGQLWSPPPAEPSVVHQGVWSPTTFSVHIIDEKTTRALWEQGFYGKGSLSRSEPNWLKREEVRQGLQETHVSEILTVQRREERMRAKWERARLEQEAIRQTRQEEAQEAAAHEASIRDAKAQTLRKLELANAPAETAVFNAPVTPANLLALPNSEADLQKGAGSEVVSNGIADSSPENTPPTSPNGRPTHMRISLPGSPVISDGGRSHSRRKSVRFSPRVESQTFNLNDPPSPNLSVSSKGDDPASLWGTENGSGVEHKPKTIKNKEHLQLMPEEAFFLSFGLGALKVTDPTNGKPLSSRELLTLFRQHSFFPPRMGPEEPELQPDDNFLVNYCVYHHFRSLGWVPRGGIKFGVDWLLYAKGPVFDHAEFGLVVIPSYTDPLWKKTGKKSPQKSWQWFHGTLRVLSHVTKSLVLVYVDVPHPSKFDAALERGFTDVFKLYKVREVMVKRWSSNRNR